MIDLKTQDNLRNIWQQYSQLSDLGDRKNANKLLLEFIRLLKQQDSKDIKAFVDDICSLKFDNDIVDDDGIEVSNNETRIQHPLFKDIILPILIEQYKLGSAKHIRWIGQFEQYFLSDYTTNQVFLGALNIEGYFESRYFFERSFEIDNDQKTLSLLLNTIAQRINYYIHEVPLGVLVDPDVLNKEILTFRHYWQQCNKKSIWEDILTKWEVIAKHWTRYSETQNTYDNFENYLKSNAIQIEL